MPFKVNTGFLPLPDHPLFVVMLVPTKGGWPSRWVLHCPAFAEEMNKSRKMVMDEARAFAQQGVGVLVPDLWGTGDSPGDFSEANWQGWHENLECILFWLKLQGCRSVTLWGLRLGCLLALDLQQNWHAGWPRLKQLVFWQPVLNAQQALTQFLRLRLASGLVASNAALETAAASGVSSSAAGSEVQVVVSAKPVKTETVKDIRERFARGEYIEVAGYTLSPNLVSQLDQLPVETLLPHAPVCWLEVKSQSDSPLSMVSQRTIDAWQQQNVEVEARSVGGEPFWATQELAHAPELIKVTCNLLLASLTPPSSTPLSTPQLTDSHTITQDPSASPFREQPMMPYREKRSADTANQALQPYVEKRLTTYREALPSDSAVSGTSEEALQFFCEGSHLYGVLHLPDGDPRQGVVLIVGGPQYRVGSHRQFVQLARNLAQAGIAVLRFDYRGMGDSEGGFEGFTDIEADVAAAVDAFERRLPQLQETVLWGLCDGATAAACYAAKDSRINGLVLLNPWVRSEAGEAKAYLRHYYWQRLMQPDLWKKIGHGRFKFRDSLGSLFGALRRSAAGGQLSGENGTQNTPDLVAQIAQGLNHFSGKVLIILSGADLTAAEFKDAMRSSRLLKRVVAQPQYQIEHLPDSDHTFSRKVWKDRVSSLTTQWMQSW